MWRGLLADGKKRVNVSMLEEVGGSKNNAIIRVVKMKKGIHSGLYQITQFLPPTFTWNR